MPAITSGRVLVTGANGYIAAWAVETLLRQGYTVKGVVRSEAAATRVKELFAAHGDRFHAHVVPNYIEEDAFDDAVHHIDAVLHIASPCHFNPSDPKDVIEPAIAGTVNILNSCLRSGNSVKRVVMTSSAGAVTHSGLDKVVFDESDWNEVATLQVELKGKAVDPRDTYGASKTLAERAAWSFMKKHQDEATFDLVVLNPPWGFGPTSTPETIGLTLGLWRDGVLGFDTNPETNPIISDLSWIDVRDVAMAHVLALQKESAGGHRILITAGPYKWQDWVDAVHAADERFPAKDPNYDSANAVYNCRFDTTLASKLLGVKYRSMQETARDSLVQFEELGLIKF